MIDDGESESGLMMECGSKILTGAEAKKFRDYMRKVKGWQNDETTVIVVLTPKRKASWPSRMRNMHSYSASSD